MCHHPLNEQTILDADLPLPAIAIEPSPQAPN
jgi:hypothetical protein